MKKIIDDMGFVSPHPFLFIFLHIPISFLLILFWAYGDLTTVIWGLSFPLLLGLSLTLRALNINKVYVQEKEDKRNNWEKDIMSYETFVRVSYHIALISFLCTPVAGGLLYKREWKHKSFYGVPEGNIRVGALNLFRLTIYSCKNPEKIFTLEEEE